MELYLSLHWENCYDGSMATVRYVSFQYVCCIISRIFHSEFVLFVLFLNQNFTCDLILLFAFSIIFEM